MVGTYLGTLLDEQLVGSETNKEKQSQRIRSSDELLWVLDPVVCETGLTLGLFMFQSRIEFGCIFCNLEVPSRTTFPCYSILQLCIAMRVRNLLYSLLLNVKEFVFPS